MLYYFRLELLPRLCVQEGYLRHVRSEDNEDQPVQAVLRLAYPGSVYAGEQICHSHGSILK